MRRRTGLRMHAVAIDEIVPTIGAT